MKRLWRRYSDCRGAECTAPVPPKYRVTPRASRVITERQKEITREYYGG